MWYPAAVQHMLLLLLLLLLLLDMVLMLSSPVITAIGMQLHVHCSMSLREQLHLLPRRNP
jgi:hypothetical protein